MSETYFRGSEVLSEEDIVQRPLPRLLVRCKVDWPLAWQAVSYDKVRCAVSNFKAYKFPRGNGTFPAVLQQGEEVIIIPMMKLFAARIFLQYVLLS
jgi:hypothetical protein